MAARARLRHHWISGDITEAYLSVDEPYGWPLDELARVAGNMFTRSCATILAFDATDTAGESECETDEPSDTDG